MTSAPRWPRTAEQLIDTQLWLAAADPPLWRLVDFDALRVAAGWVKFRPRRGRPRGCPGSSVGGKPDHHTNTGDQLDRSGARSRAERSTPPRRARLSLVI
jgi:hypothetical protein